MIKKTIYPRTDTTIPAISKSYRFNGGTATVQLDSLGNYEVLVNGSRYSSQENSAKRDAGYKPAVSDVSLKMVTAFEKRDAQFTMMHKNAPRMQKHNEQQKKIDALSPQKYTRQNFPLSRPMREDVRKELEAEAAIRFVDVYDDKKKERTNFVTEAEKEAMAARLRGYEEIQAFFEELEDGKEARANALFQKEYERQRKEIEDYINGEVSVTEQNIQTILSEINLPFRVEIESVYDKAKGLLTSDIEFYGDLNLPTSKTNILSTGRISVKDKLVKEIEQFRTETIVSMVYYFAASLFNTAINIQTQRISVWLNGKREALLWIQFDRTQFGKLSMRTVNTMLNYYDWPHVDALRVVRGAYQFDPIDSNCFKNAVSQAMREAGAIAPNIDTTEAGPHKNSDGSVSLDVRKARKLLSLLPDDYDLKIKVREMEQKGYDKVILPSKYWPYIKDLGKE